MATINTIGTTSRDYSTLQAWEDAVPATPTGGYEGHCYNDSEFTAGVIINGHTTSGTDYIRLTAAAGQSFQDHAGVRTNPLIYDQSKGVGIAANTGGGADLIDLRNGFTTFDRLQIRRTGASYSGRVLSITAGVTTVLVQDCIFLKQGSSSAGHCLVRDSKMVNCLVYDTGATATNSAISLNTSGLAQNCTCVRSGAAGGAGITSSYATNLSKGSNSFGWTTAFSGTFAAGSGYNCSDSATVPGSNNQVSKTFADQFVSTTADYRLKAGADCINTGNTDSTYPNDITGTARGLTTAGDIGAWEFVEVAGSSGRLPLLPRTFTRSRESSWPNRLGR